VEPRVNSNKYHCIFLKFIIGRVSLWTLFGPNKHKEPKKGFASKKCPILIVDTLLLIVYSIKPINDIEFLVPFSIIDTALYMIQLDR
jgi:hypothetical protein